MAGKPAIQVKGAKELRAALTRLGEGVSDLKAIHLEAANVVAGQARLYAPVLTGALEGSIRASGTKTRGVVRFGRQGIPYAGVIHFGWPAHNISPNPFAYDAMEDKQDEVVRLYEDRVEALVNRVFAETPP